ncbi:uncharacterized protein LOC109611544 [Ooceraea biroi]|uniref:uncharacterized protein LOC109611544 n=1 Tax=Ooceraea biroi TaxID=2015173 RepID=UPI000971638F|nr:uncharacterized protein LOC109611544 [Ooceraea biroi]
MSRFIDNKLTLRVRRTRLIAELGDLERFADQLTRTLFSGIHRGNEKGAPCIYEEENLGSKQVRFCRGLRSLNSFKLRRIEANNFLHSWRAAIEWVDWTRRHATRHPRVAQNRAANSAQRHARFMYRMSTIGHSRRNSAS